MAALFNVKILLPTGAVYDGDISSLVAPAETGYLGILAHHAPLIARLKAGNIILRDPSGKTKSFALKSGGFLEVSDNSATLILDSLELPS